MIQDTGVSSMKKTFLAALTASLLSVNSYCIDGDAGVLINEAQNQNVSEEDLKTIFELKAESIRLTEQIKQEMAASSVSNDVDERSLLIQSKKALYELKETMDPETYERLITSLTEQEKSAADSSSAHSHHQRKTCLCIRYTSLHHRRWGTPHLNHFMHQSPVKTTYLSYSAGCFQGKAWHHSPNASMNCISRKKTPKTTLKRSFRRTFRSIRFCSESIT